MKLTWLGHSCFKVESGGYEIVLDPYEDGSVPGYPPVREEADAVLCSHEHADHGARHRVALRQGRKATISVEEIHTWHDDARGAKRGPNTIHILDDGVCRIAHLGDLGCDLMPEQKEQLKGLTALLIPVGGFFTIDAVQAKRLAEELQPIVIVPMHYRGEGFGYDVIGPLSAYTDLCSDVVFYPSRTLELSPGMKRQTAVLTLPVQQ